MIKRIVCYFLLGFCILALSLSLIGVKQVAFGDTYYTFFHDLMSTYSRWEISIPSIPKLSKYVSESTTGGIDILGVLKKFFQVVCYIINACIDLLNFCVTLVNTLIHILQFSLTFIYKFRDFVQSFKIESLAVLTKNPLSLFGVGDFR